MKAVQFNDNWYVKHLAEAGLGTPVTLPHDAMLSEPRSELSAGGINTGWDEGRCHSKNSPQRRPSPLVSAAS